MNNMYYFEVPYSCTCEKCKKRYTGILRRGPLQIGNHILATNMQSSMNTVEMKLSKKLIENDIENSTNKSFIDKNEGKCPYCRAYQSWYPMNKPKKGSYMGLYILSLILIPLLGMLIWAIFFFDDMIPFIITEGISILIGIILPYRYQKNHKKEDENIYQEQEKDYLIYLEQMKKNDSHHKPTINWEEAKHIPIE